MSMRDKTLYLNDVTVDLLADDDAGTVEIKLRNYDRTKELTVKLIAQEAGRLGQDLYDFAVHSVSGHSR